MHTIRPYPCSDPDSTTVPHCAAWIGVPLATARSSPACVWPGRLSPKRPVSVAPCTGVTIRPDVQPPATAGAGVGVEAGAGGVPLPARAAPLPGGPGGPGGGGAGGGRPAPPPPAAAP